MTLDSSQVDLSTSRRPRVHYVHTSGERPRPPRSDGRRARRPAREDPARRGSLAPVARSPETLVQLFLSFFCLFENTRPTNFRFA